MSYCNGPHSRGALSPAGRQSKAPVGLLQCPMADVKRGQDAVCAFRVQCLSEVSEDSLGVVSPKKTYEAFDSLTVDMDPDHRVWRPGRATGAATIHDRLGLKALILAQRVGSGSARRVD